jgi:regulator of replication initiation timing
MSVEENRKLDHESARLRAELKNMWSDPWEKAKKERQEEREKEKASK